MHENLNGFVFRRVSKTLHSPKIKQCKQKKLTIRPIVKKSKVKNKERKAENQNINMINTKIENNITKIENNITKPEKFATKSQSLNGFVFRVGKKSDKGNQIIKEQISKCTDTKKKEQENTFNKENINNKTVDNNKVTPYKKIILNKIKEPTPFRFDKNDFLDIKTPKKSIFYNESFLINSRNKKRPSIFDKNLEIQNEEKNIELNIKNTTDENINCIDDMTKKIKDVVYETLQIKPNNTLECYKYENLNKKIESDFVKYIAEYKLEIENIKNEIEKWKRIKENVFFENDYYYEAKTYEIKEYRKNEEYESKRKIEINYEKILVWDENANEYKVKLIKEIENVNNRIQEIKHKIFGKIENRSKMDPVTLCKALSRL